MDNRTDEQLVEVLERFVLRARRILAHSLCASEEGLQNLADGAWYASRKDGVDSISRRLPAEEAVESLAARVRPLLLQEDGVHYNTILNALTSLLSRRNLPDEVEWCKRLKKDWKSVDLKGGTAGYSLSVTQEGSATPPVAMTDLGLAGSWFYGDVLHADQDQIEAGSSFGIGQRFAAAAVRTAQLAILTRELLSYVNSLVEYGHLELDEHVLTSIPVKVEPEDVQLKGLYSAQVGTPMPSPSEVPNADAWSQALPVDKDGEWIMRIPWGGDE